jgi:hypothetical protein
VVSFTPRPLYLRGKSSRVPLDRRLDGPQNLSEHCETHKNVLTLRGSNISRPARSPSLHGLSYISIYGSISLLDLGRFFSFLIYTRSVGLLGRGNQPVARPLPAHRTTQTQIKSTQTSISRVGFDPTIPVFEWAKTIHALDGAVTLSARTELGQNIQLDLD